MQMPNSESEKSLSDAVFVAENGPVRPFSRLPYAQSPWAKYLRKSLT